MTTNLKRLQIDNKDIWIDANSLQSVAGLGQTVSRPVINGNKTQIRITEDQTTKIGSVQFSVANYDVAGNEQNPVLLFRKLKAQNNSGGCQIDILSESGGVDEQHTSCSLMNDLEQSYGPDGSVMFMFQTNPSTLTNQ
jgi:hypothetical protein